MVSARRCALNLIELIVLICIAACTLLGAAFFRTHVDGRFSWVFGGFVGFISIPTVAALAGLVHALAIGGIPRFPSCRNGICRGSDYELKRFGDEFD